MARLGEINLFTETKMMPTKHAKRSAVVKASGIVELLAGIWLYLSPWIYGVTYSGTAYNSWIMGVLIAIVAGFQLSDRDETAGLTALVNCLLGIWTFASPWMLGYTDDTGRFVSSLCAGAIVFIVAVWSMTSHSRPEQKATPSM